MSHCITEQNEQTLRTRTVKKYAYSNIAAVTSLSHIEQQLYSSHFQGQPGYSWYQNVSILDFIGKDYGNGSSNWSYKAVRCAKLQSNHHLQHPAFFTLDALPVV